MAIRNARVLTMTGEELSDATVLFRGGEIVEVGSDVDVPAGTEIVDAAGGTVMPGLVSAYSRAGFPKAEDSNEGSSRSRRWRSRRNRGSSTVSAKNEAAKKVADQLYARQDVFGELLECGVTTLAVVPDGSGFPGRAAVLDPAGKDRASLVIDDDAFVVIAPATGTGNKKLLKEALEKAGEKEEKKKPADKKPAEKPAEEGEKNEPAKEGKPDKGEKKEPPADKKSKGEKSDKKAEKKKPADPNREVLKDLLAGKRRAFLKISSAQSLAHFLQSVEEIEMPEGVVVWTSMSSSSGRLDEVTDHLDPVTDAVLMPPSLTTPSYSRAVVNPAARLAASGFEVGFLPGDSRDDVRQIFFRLMELVRHGLDRDVALAGVTSVPAKALGLADRVGSIEEGKAADLLLFDGDPLDPSTRLVGIWHNGQAIDKDGAQ